MNKSVLAILLLGFAFAANLRGQATPDDSLLLAAKNQIWSFTGVLPEQDLADYGFNSKAEFRRIRFDKPVWIYTLKDTIVAFTNTWRIPVTVDGEYRALLTIIKEDGNYKAVDFGATVLARDYQAKKTPNTIGLLRIYELRSDFLIEKKPDNQIQFIPVQNLD